MRKLFTITALALGVFASLTGCKYLYAYNPDGDWPVRYSGSVNVVRYVQENYPVTTHITMYDRYNPPPPAGSYTILANLSRDGWRRDEGMIMGAILWKARQLGATGLINVGESSGDAIADFSIIGNQGGVSVSNQGSKPLFRGIAIRQETAASQPIKPASPAPTSTASH